MSSAVIDSASLQHLVPVLIDRGYRVMVPTVSDNAIPLAELSSADDLPQGLGVGIAPAGIGSAAATTTRCLGTRPPASTSDIHGASVRQSGESVPALAEMLRTATDDAPTPCRRWPNS